MNFWMIYLLEILKMGTIYYLIPDLHKRDFSFRTLYRAIRDRQLMHFIRHKVLVKHKPVGGIKVMYQHCMMLNEMGFTASPLILGDYIGNFFGYELDVKNISEIGYNLNPDDIVVCPEFMPYLGLQFTGCKKILFNQSQSWRYIEKRLKKGDEGKNYIQLGYDYVINCSEHLCKMLKSNMNMESFAITNGIDQSRFFPIPDKRIKGRILAMSRKHPEDLRKIIRLSTGLGYEFRIVDGLTEDELIDEYQTADIFLATGYPEGFSLPQLEAMNCGCVVVGFTGGGGDEYMIDNETALVADDGDCEQVVVRLAQLKNNDAFKEMIRKNGFEKAKLYTLDNTKRMLSYVYNQINALES